MVVTRFAPSPNGPLHLGHAYAAVVAHDLAREHKGRFVLRIEDLDRGRARAALVAEIRADLAWLGLGWDDVAPQSERAASYLAAAERLKALGVLYPCICTRAQIAVSAAAQGPDGPVYPGTCRNRTVDPEGASWRLDVAKAETLTGPLEWIDEIAGLQRANPRIFGDVALLRGSGEAAYHLAVTLDDAADGISLVTRGADLFAASHVHRLLQALLGLPVPVWHHHPLLFGSDLRKLAKRRGSPGLAARRQAGEDGLALAADLRAERFPSGISLSTILHSAPWETPF